MASVTAVIYPMLAKAAGDGDFDKIESAYKQGFRMMTVLLLPASVFLFVYAEDLIRLVFEYGNFGSNSTNITYPLLQVFAISVFSLSLNTYITRFFYAFENMLLPNLFNIISVFGVNIIIILLFIDEFGAAAIAYGTVISAVFNMLLLIMFAKVKFNLAICNWSLFVKITAFTMVTIITISAIALLPISSVVLSLLTGGLLTGLLIGVGLKFVK